MPRTIWEGTQAQITVLIVTCYYYSGSSNGLECHWRNNELDKPGGVVEGWSLRDDGNPSLEKVTTIFPDILMDE